MSLVTGRSETMLTFPCTRGSRMKFFPVCWPMVLITDWMSALTKLTVIFSSPFAAADSAVAVGAGAWAETGRAIAQARASGASARPAALLRKLVTIWGFDLDLSGHFALKPR